MTHLTDKELEVAYNRASILGDGEKCDEILNEMDRRRDEEMMEDFNYVGSRHHY